MANQQNLSRRAALRQQQELEEKQKRTNRIIGIGAGILVVAILAIIAIVAIPPLLRSDAEVTAEQLTPPNATEEHGILLTGTEPSEDTPHVIIYEDFLCPACASRALTYGPVINQLADAGEITVEYRMTYFMDRQGDASARAAMAAAAADEVGHFREYHMVAYANQGQYSNRQLREEFPQQAGIEGEDLERFQELYDTRAFRDFAAAAHQGFHDNGIGSTPTFVVNGKRLVFADPQGQEVYIQPTPESFMAAVNAAFNDEDARTHQPL